MSFPFTREGRIVVPISSPERAHDVAAGIERWLEKFKVRDIRWEGNVLHFTGDHVFRLQRLLCSKLTPFDGMGPSSLKFEDRPTEVVIEYALTVRFILHFLTIVTAAVAVMIGSGQAQVALFALPVLALIHGTVWLLAGLDFKSNLRIAATRGMADAAERELHALQAS